MADDLRIRRDHSALADGTLFGRRRGLSPWKIGLWILSMLLVGGIAWQFNTLQPTVLAWVGTAPTVTPSNITYAEKGYVAYLQGDLETAIDNYCLAAHGIPQSEFSDPRCIVPDPNSSYTRNADVNVVYELVRTLVYRSYDDRRLGIYTNSAEVWGRIVATDNPKNGRAHAIYAFALTNNYHAEQAVPEGLSAISLNPTDGNAYAYLSMAYFSSSRLGDALDAGAKAVALADQSVDAHIAYAQALFVTDQNDNAQAEYEAATKINPHLTFPYFYLAIFFLNRQQQEAAIAEYDQVLAMNNKSVKAYTRKCAAYFNIGRTTQALESCKNATTLDPSYAEAWQWQGQVLYNRRDYEDALVALKTCQDLENASVTKGSISAADQLPQCWYLQGLAYYALDAKGDTCKAKAIPLFNEVLSFTTNTQAIKLTRIGMAECAALVPGLATPTPLPQTPTPRAPIQ